MDVVPGRPFPEVVAPINLVPEIKTVFAPIRRYPRLPSVALGCRVAVA